ncbi:uncharacterized protein F4812DRAFT_405803 [Daldinia caldariorum]|uniref:uncharacterized protein n=1 Tax=Daldinia caldariorum TaxID=326644 RepID=UPI002007A901|nr:uncharacterized protein F4812DRAFT_405803 [Daldinia caldariorum]KAI1467701.1 hypothetical protein F4812DRAFT_405803 [Daldinia caldariorum]
MKILLLVLTIASFAFAQFLNPHPVQATWKIGEIQNINFKTAYTTFSIALWQQGPDGSSATLGPIVFQTVNNAATQFTWLVQAYDFDLAVSNVFFFWMFDGDPSLQGNQQIPQMSSAFFTISNETMDSTTTETSPSSTLPFQVTTEGTTPGTTQGTAQATTQAATTQLAIPTPPSSTIDQPGEATQNETAEKEPDDDLSAGAKTGIGVSAGVVGLLIIVCTGLYIAKLKKQVATQSNPSREMWSGPPPVEIDSYTQRPKHAELP